jgi:thioredoxin-like negative regulator of GroEL
MKLILKTILILMIFVGSSVNAETIEFNQSTFDRLQREGKPILISIHANWCPTCRAQTTVIEHLLKQKEYKNYASLRVDFDNQKDIVRAFHAYRQSTLIVFKGNKEVARSLADTSDIGIEILLREAL